MKAISKEAILNDVQRVFDTYGNTTREFYLEHGKYSRAPINRHFGTWNNLLKELNKPLNMRKQYDIDRNEILSEMLSIYNEYGYLTSELQRKVSTYSQSTIERVFGSFNNMLKVLGLPPNSSGNRYNYKDIKDKIINIYRNNGYISYNLIENECGITYQGLSKKYNIHSIKDICIKFGIPELYGRPDSLEHYTPYNKMISSLLNEEPIYEKTFDWLINPKTNNHLKVDMYYPNNNLAVEIDGLDHYKIKKGQVHIYLKRDIIKQDLLALHNIPLVRIKNFVDNENSIKQMISQVISA